MAVCKADGDTAGHSCQPLAVAILNVGQGDSICLQTAISENYMIDGGKAKRGTVAGHRRGHGVTTLEAVILTHPDADHFAGLSTVFQDISTTSVIYNSEAKTTQAYQNSASESERQAFRTVIV